MLPLPSPRAPGTAEKAADGFLDAKGTYVPEDMAVVHTADGRGTVYLDSGVHEPTHTLDSRGWVLLEFLLSSRLLIFSEYELLWPCKQIDLRGVDNGGGGLEYLQLLQGIPWASFNEDNAGLYGSCDEEKKYVWKLVVEQYTRRRLSDAGDKLNALRGNHEGVGGVVGRQQLLWAVGGMVRGDHGLVHPAGYWPGGEGRGSGRAEVDSSSSELVLGFVEPEGHV